MRTNFVLFILLLLVVGCYLVSFSPANSLVVGDYVLQASTSQIKIASIVIGIFSLFFLYKNFKEKRGQRLVIIMIFEAGAAFLICWRCVFVSFTANSLLWINSSILAFILLLVALSYACRKDKYYYKYPHLK